MFVPKTKKRRTQSPAKTQTALIIQGKLRRISINLGSLCGKVEAELLFITSIIISHRFPFVNSFFHFFQKSFRRPNTTNTKGKHNRSRLALRPNIISLIPRKKKEHGCAGKNIKRRCGSSLYSGLSLYTHFCDL
jgi:hypothetical protein